MVALKVPASQNWHVDELLAPIAELNLPATQLVQEAAPGPLYDPAAQGAQATAPAAALKVPGAHTAHVEALLAPTAELKVPAEQDTQAAVPLANVPAGQEAAEKGQEAEAAVLNDPHAQQEQAAAPAARKDPAAQGTHEAGALAKVPAGHVLAVKLHATEPTVL